MAPDDEQLGDEQPTLVFVLPQTARIGYQLRRGGGPLLDLLRQAAADLIEQDAADRRAGCVGRRAGRVRCTRAVRCG
jgi:hypothetical protein